MNKFVYGLLIVIGVGVYACNGQQEQKTNSQATEKEEVKAVRSVDYLSLEYPVQNRLYTLGDTIHLVWNRRQPADSAEIQMDGMRVAIISGDAQSFVLTTKNTSVGTHWARIVSYYGESKESDDLKFKLASDIKPEQQACKVVKRYPHDPVAYTQGLFVHEGQLYEGTGQYGESSLRKVDLATGDVLESLSMPQKYFGEGIAAYQDKIIQLTWRSKVGFVYDRESFQLLQKVKYPTDGWGITYDGTHLLMSDGSATLFFLEPDYFSEVKRQEVWNHEGPVDMLNELEYVDGLLYANVWQTATIVVIEPETGRVLKEIDCSQLVPNKYRGDRDNVLNGIAYKADTQTFLLTGKRWSTLYEVRFANRK